MAWLSLTLEPVAQAHVELLSSALFDAGAQGITDLAAEGFELPLLQPWDQAPDTPQEPAFSKLVAWFEDPDVEQTLQDLAPFLHGVRTAWSSEGADVDWSTHWQRHFEPVRVGPITITPPWLPEPGAIVLEPGAGFGTGQHASTRMILRMMVDLWLVTEPGHARVLDVGTGSGILALAASKLGGDAYGIDIDPLAIEQARHTARANDLHATFDTTPLHELREPAAFVLANLHAELIAAFAPQLDALCGEHLLLAGILADRESLVRDALAIVGDPVERVQQGEWVALRYMRCL